MAESVLAAYYLRVNKSQPSHYQEHESPTDLKPTDYFMFQVTLKKLIGRPSVGSTPRGPRSGATTLFQTHVITSCKHFFGDTQDFKERLIAPPYLTPECLDQITPIIMLQVQRLFPSYEPAGPASDLGTGFEKPSDLKGRLFPLDLEIVVEEVPCDDEELVLEVMEESMHDNVVMVPASNEAIQSLETYKIPKRCHVCMEDFHDGDDDDECDDVLFTPLPCGHGFHHHCIVQWLQTSHFCPLCRYPMN